MTLVSVVTPSYNQAAFLGQTLDSILNQDHRELECLVVDGGSSDGSVDIIRGYADRLTWWVSEPDRGQADAINKGFAHARGEILAWLNSDDYYLPGAIGRVVKVFESHPELVLVYGNMQAVDEAGHTINLLSYGERSLKDLLCFQMIGQPAAFMRRQSVNDVGGLNSEFRLLLDHQLWIKLAAIGPIMHIDEIWAAARYHAAAKNRARAAEFGAEAFRILDWAAQDPRLAPVLRSISRRARAAANRVDSRYLLDAGKPEEALRAWMRALVLHPATAIARPNLIVSALLELSGLGAIREAVLRNRKQRLSR